jgi:hypothetical protein
VFDWLSKGSEQATADRKLLPRPYRRLIKSGAFKDAFYNIPDEVRRNPKAFLPIRKSLSLIETLAPLLSKAGSEIDA